ncbi:hypothetical protein GW864_04925, partial [bacterium]|nr:hypothetical protein [bacterium]
PDKDYFQWKATLSPPSGQANTPQLTSVDIKYIADTENPTNPTTTNGWTSSAKTTELTNGGYGSANAPSGPYFEWSGATDDVNVYGYYVYFGTDNTAEPLTAGTFQTGTSFTNSTSLTSDTTYYLRIRSRDNTDNKYTNADTSVYTLFTYGYDVTGPSQIEYVNASPSGCSKSNSYSFTWPVPSVAGAPLDHYVYKVGPSGAETNVSTNSVSNLTPYQEGANVFYIKGVDSTGNVATNWATVVFCHTGAAIVSDGPYVEAKPSAIIVTWSTNKKSAGYVRVTQGNTYVSEQGHTEFALNHKVKVLGLRPNQNYEYQLRWIDEDANLSESGMYSTHTTAEPLVQDLTVSEIRQTTAIVSFKVTSAAKATLRYGRSLPYDTQISLGTDYGVS